MMAYQRSNGFVLFTVLIFMQLFSLMSIYGLTTAAIALKINQHRWLRDQYSSAANQILHDLENNLLRDESICMIPVLSAAWIAKQSLVWWQQHACSGNFGEMRYYYAVEWLGKNDCGVISKIDNNQWLTANYYRITLFLLPNRFPGSKLILQSTIAKPSANIPSCPGKTYSVIIGRQMRRELLGRKTLAKMSVYENLKDDNHDND